MRMWNHPRLCRRPDGYESVVATEWRNKPISANWPTIRITQGRCSVCRRWIGRLPSIRPFGATIRPHVRPIFRTDSEAFLTPLELMQYVRAQQGAVTVEISA